MTKRLTKSERAEQILELIRKVDPAEGRWEDRQKGPHTIPVWMMESGDGWTAQADLGNISKEEAESLVDPLAGHNHNMLFDLWENTTGTKMLSLRRDCISGTVNVISMRTDQLEAVFGQ